MGNDFSINSRVESKIHRIISETIIHDIKDPRLRNVSINEVKLSRMTGGHLFNKHNTGSERVACGASGQIKTGAKGVEDRVGEKPTNITPQPTVLALFPAA